MMIIQNVRDKVNYMQIQALKLYNQKFGNSYYSADYLTNKKRPSEVELIEELASKYEKDGEKVSLYYVFCRIGKIFEKYAKYDKAIAFYNKAKETLDPSTKAYKVKSENIDFDIERVLSKKFGINNNWNV